MPVLVIHTGSVYADFGLILDNTCLAYHKNNLTSDCPTYEELNLIYPDTTKPEISGGFVFKDNIWQREKPPLNDHFEYYRPLNQNEFWIDPPGDTIDRIKIIRITSSDFEYTLGGQVLNDTSYQIGKSRFVNDRCNEIIITAQDWLYLLGDSMRLLQNNCDPAFTSFNEVVTIQWEKTIHDIKTSYKYKFDKWVKESLAKCLGKCFEY